MNADERRNVVLVTVDSLRADVCSFMGHEGEATPALDTLATDGLVFEHAIAPGPSTSESMPAILTGHYPAKRPGTDGALDERIARIRPHMRAHQTLAEKFSRAGYATAAFTPNPFTTRFFGFDEGFDHFQDFLGPSRKRLYERLLDGAFRGNRLYMPVRVLLNFIRREEVFKPWDAFYDEILEWTESQTRPYFLWVMLMDAHHPYLASDEHRSDSRWHNAYVNWKLRAEDYEPPFSPSVHEGLVTAYEDSVRYADSFLDSLRRDLATDEPVLVVTGDHGEAFGEHGTYEHHGGAFGEHGDQEFDSYLYEENIHVPLVVANADRSGSVQQPLSLRSIPDLFAISDDAFSINTGVTDPFVTAQTMDGDSVAVRGRRWKLLSEGESTTLYDLQRGETQERTKPELASNLQLLAQHRRQGNDESASIVAAAGRIADRMESNETKH